MSKVQLNTLSPSLDAAIEALYDAFASYPWRKTMPACPHCLQTYPGFSEALPEIPAERLHYYLFKAMSTIGEVKDFKHYFPRMLDAWAHEYVGGESILYHEILGGKLAYAAFDAWPAAEQEAVQQFFRVLWEFLLAHYPLYPDVEATLCTIGQFTSLQPFLQIWRDTLTQPSLAYLAEMVMSPPTGGGFWKSTEFTRLTNWLCDEQTDALFAIARQEAEWGGFNALFEAEYLKRRLLG